MSTLYTIVMDSILPEIIKSRELGEKLSKKLYTDMDTFCAESELHTQVVKYFTTSENPDSDYSGIVWTSTDKYLSTSSCITEAILYLGSVIEACSVWPKYTEGDMHTYVPVSLMKEVCKAYLTMKELAS
ncbi:MAG: hypothetical protein PHG66_04370 [Candidatus Colwellbacteria bacterium]|nr:hypothetical protein [Candidatus Colwellbacteria bacterium]